MSRKRIFDVLNFELFEPILHQKKKYKKSWISGTSVHNYLQKEPLLDWFNLYYEKNRVNIRTNKVNQGIKPLNLLMSKGNEFENKIYDDILARFPSNAVKIYSTPGGIITKDDFNLTLNAIKKDIPILLQVPLMNDKIKLRGVADIVIRSDWINRIYDREVIPLNEQKTPNGNYYYVVIDIKYTSMTLCANGYTIRNEGRFKGYKGQLLIYNIALGLLQNYIPKKTYIMSKNWKIDKKNNIQEGFNAYDLLGVIDYDDFDKQYIESTSNAIAWINKVRQYGVNWDPENPKIPEMCVNMCNTNDEPWHKVKCDIVSKTKDPTAIWMITPENRDKAFTNKIFKYTDKRCTTDILGLEPTNKRTKVIDSILKINQQSTIKIKPQPSDITDNRCNWLEEYPTDFYIDFETLNDIFITDSIDIHNASNRGTFIFMIGVAYKINGELKYQCFKAKKYSNKQEKKVIYKFKTFIDNLKDELDPNNKYPLRFFHWSHCEQSLLSSAIIKHQSLSDLFATNITWVDLCNIFMKEPIVINGSVNFKLKDVAKAMKSHNMISTEWPRSTIMDGLNAMVMAGKYYEKKRKQILTENDKLIFNDIIKYNETDCKILVEIVEYFRKN
jgi:hypothetical protein